MPQNLPKLSAKNARSIMSFSNHPHHKQLQYIYLSITQAALLNHNIQIFKELPVAIRCTLQELGYEVINENNSTIVKF